MKKITIHSTDLHTSILSYGCMNIGGNWNAPEATTEVRSMAYNAINAALDEGINLFDHADIYVRGRSEDLFGELLKKDPGLRDNLILQSKCGIRFAGDPQAHSPGRYDFSYDHIIQSVEGILNRLHTDRLDLLLLHRPDALVQPEEVARAFDHLHQSGKVRWFGVSNHTKDQIELLKTAVTHPLVINQVEISLLHRSLIEEGMLFNQDSVGIAGSSGTLDYCRKHKMLIQAWSPVAGGKLFIHGRGAPDALIHLIQGLARDYQTSVEAIALAWLMRHPARIQPIIGTVNPDRIRASAMAASVDLSHEDWYRLLIAARGESMP
jgi:predicted oxidoreductase